MPEQTPEYFPKQPEVQQIDVEPIHVLVNKITELSALSGRTPRYLDASSPEADIKMNTPFRSNHIYRKLVRQAAMTTVEQEVQPSPQPPKTMRETDHVRRRSMRRER